MVITFLMNKKLLYCLLLAVTSFSVYYFFYADLPFNPYYGDDYRYINFASDYKIEELVKYFFNPIFDDYFSRAWVSDRPVYYILLKGVRWFFGDDPSIYYFYGFAILVSLRFFFFFLQIKFWKIRGSHFF